MLNNYLTHNNKLNIKFAIILYIALTFMEWFMHKYLMHSQKGELLYTEAWSQSHLNHHKKVQNNNKVKSKNPEGMIFTWFPALVAMAIPMAIVIYSINKYLETGYSNQTILIILSCIAVAYGSLWNTLHISFHDADIKYSALHAFPSTSIHSYIKQFTPVQWLWKNHTYHHLNKGANKGNFNIILPGADFIMGTYRNKIDNTQYCKENKNTKDPKIIELCKHKPNINKIAKNMHFAK